MDIINIVFIIISAALCIAAAVSSGQASGKNKSVLKTIKGKVSRAGKMVSKAEKLSPAAAFIEKHHRYIAAAIMITAVLIRFWDFPNIPAGLNQDEASIGYDSYAIGNYGVDRNGDVHPVYPIAFGDGHGPLYTYLSIPAIRILGLSIFSYRLTNTLLSCIAVFVFYLLAKRIGGKGFGLTAMALIATCPTSIISARWALDGNPLPSVFIIAMYLLTLAADKQKTWLYMLSAGVFSLSVYSYGPAGVVVPIFLVLSCIYLIRYKKLTITQFLLGIATFAVIITPLAIFMAINVFDLPAVKSSVITFAKFTVMRSGSVFLPFDANYIPNLIKNTGEYLLVIIAQRQDLIWNMVPGFGTTYLYTAPLIIFGTVVLIIDVLKKKKEYNRNIFILYYFIASSVMGIMIYQNVNRLSIIFPSILLLIAFAVMFMAKHFKPAGITVAAMAAVCFCMFSYHYFNVYPEIFGRSFFYSFGDALENAMQRTDKTIYVTETYQNEPSVIALFYSKLPPDRFYETVKYYDDKAEWRNAMYFDRFKFGIPAEKSEDAVYVIDNSEIDQFDRSIFDIDTYKYYSVAYSKLSRLG